MKITKEDRLTEEFLSLPTSVETDPNILSVIEALMGRRMENGSDDFDAWAEQLSGVLSRFID